MSSLAELDVHLSQMCGPSFGWEDMATFQAVAQRGNVGIWVGRVLLEKAELQFELHERIAHLPVTLTISVKKKMCLEP